MAYPILFPYGEPGYSKNIEAGIKLTVRKFYAARLAIRRNFSVLHSSTRLFQQYFVEQYVKMQNQRLSYIHNHQKRLRVESYQGVHDYVHSIAEKRRGQPGHTEKVNIGKMIIFSSSFTDSPRYLQEKYQDTIAIVRQFGKQDLFITFTCNPKWLKITENIPKYQSVEHRPDLVTRVSALKLAQLKHEIF